MQTRTTQWPFKGDGYRGLHIFIKGVTVRFGFDVWDGECFVYAETSSIPSIDVNTSGTITIPSEVEGLKVASIDSYAFYKCANITKVIIPNGIKSIGKNAFYQCSSLSTITGIGQLEFIGNWAFSGTPWYDNLPDGFIYLGKVLYSYKGTMPEETKLTIKEGTLSISETSFQNMKNLVSVRIPQSLTGDISSKNADSTYNNATLYVPEGSKINYICSEGWNKFKNIVEGEPQPETTTGDLNSDGTINATDLVSLANIILTNGTYTAVGDMNSDNTINATDFVTLANNILKGSNAKKLVMARAAEATNGISIEPFTISAGEEKELFIDMTSPNADNSFSGGSIQFKNILLVTPKEEETKPDDFEYGVTTGIKTVKADADKNDQSIYDLQGRRLTKPVKGINIIGGKKVVIK